MIHSRDVCLSVVTAVLFLLLQNVASAQQTTEILRGRVTSDGNSVSGATVTVVGSKSGIERSARTNGDGVYTILFTEPEGVYSVRIRAVGFAEERQTIVRRSPSTIMVNNFTLRRIGNTLKAVAVEAKKERPRVRLMDGKSIAGHERDIKEGALFSLDPTDLTSLLQYTPGVFYIPGQNGEPGQFSVLGAPPSENKIVVDGTTIEGSQLPADVINKASIATTTFDPSQGQFSGGIMSVTTMSGSNLWRGRVGVRGTGSLLAWHDRSATIPAQQYQRLNTMWQGPLIRNKLFYLGAVDVNHSTTALPTLLALPRTTVDQYGLIRDTIAAVAHAVEQLGIPLTGSSSVPEQRNRTISSFFKINASPSATTSAQLSLNLNQQQSDGLGISAMSYPFGGRHRTSRTANIQSSVSHYVNGFFNETRLSFSRSQFTDAPYHWAPSATVRVPTQFADGRTGLTQLTFGGGADGVRERSLSRWELGTETSWLSMDTRHRVVLTGLLQSERASANAVSGLGTFQYQTLDELAAGTPSAYTRRFAAVDQSVQLTKWAASLGDEWRVAKAWRIQYGLRLDGARPGTSPRYNATVDSLFGYRTDRIPGFSAFSPRLGISFGEGGGRLADGTIVMPGASWDLFTKNAFIGATLPLYFNGGIGAFRGVPSVSSISTFMNATGLSNDVYQLTCVGPATPISAWPQFLLNPATVPTTCRDGATATPFATVTPDVQLYDPTFQPPVSWRASFNIAGLQALGWDGSIYVDYAIGKHQPSRIDQNLRRDPVFVLSDEASRPVYVDVASIIPGTGSMTSSASRRHEQFGRVMTTMSDLTSHTGQITLGISRNRPLFAKFPLSLDYTYFRNRAEVRGGDGPTAGDPWQIATMRSSRPTHTFGINTSARVRWMSVGMRLALTSGYAFTPVVAGDINGDGLANDLAFVFDPQAASSGVMRAQMTELLQHANAGTRACLTQQLRAIAGLSSCQTGWRLQPILALGIANPSRGIEFVDRMSFTIATTNVMSALTRILGASRTSFGRMTGQPMIDNRLLYIDGFNPTTQSFQYRVNQQFGDDQSQRTVTVRAPFQVHLGAEIKFGGLARDRLITEFGLKPIHGESTPNREWFTQRLRRLTSNPMTEILAMRDSVQLSAVQVTQIERLKTTFQLSADSAYSPLLDLLIQKRGRVSDSEMLDYITPIRIKLAKMMIGSLRELAPILRTEQRLYIPAYMQQYLPREEQP